LDASCSVICARAFTSSTIMLGPVARDMPTALRARRGVPVCTSADATQIASAKKKRVRFMMGDFGTMSNIPGILVEKPSRLAFSNISDTSNSRKLLCVSVSLVSRVEGSISSMTVAKVARSINNITMPINNTIMTISIAMSIAGGSILGNNGVSLGSTVVYFVVLAIAKDITMSIAVVSISMDSTMTISFTITINIVMTMAGGSVLDNNGVSLGSTVVYFVVLAIVKDITISHRGTAMAISIITLSLC